jgi:hypothetical protein
MATIRRAARGRIFPEPLHDVRPVYTRAMDHDEHFTGRGLRHGPFGRPKHVRPPGLGNLDDRH